MAFVVAATSLCRCCAASGCVMAVVALYWTLSCRLWLPRHGRDLWWGSERVVVSQKMCGHAPCGSPNPLASPLPPLPPPDTSVLLTHIPSIREEGASTVAGGGCGSEECGEGSGQRDRFVDAFTRLELAKCGRRRTEVHQNLASLTETHCLMDLDKIM